MRRGRAETMRGLPDIVRAPNHVGDLIMAMPSFLAAPDADVVVLRSLAPLMTLMQRNGATIPVARGHKQIRADAQSIRDVRRHRFGVVLTYSFSTVALFKLAHVRFVRATPTDGRRILLSESVDNAIMSGRSRPSAYYQLVTGIWPATPPIPRIEIPEDLRARWWNHAGLLKQPLIGIFPGASASSRRWDPPRFAEVVRALSKIARVVVFGGPGETALTREVAGVHALDMGGRTDLPMLAAALAECALLITNDSGSWHVAGAVGTPTLALLGAGDPVETAVLGAQHVMIRRPELPCVPCVLNKCPRATADHGYILPDPDRECLRLISTQDVIATAQTMLASR